MFLDELFGHSNSTYLAVMPSRLLYAVRLAHPIFRGFHQHDSQEFLRLFMDTLASETKVPHFAFEETPTPKENQDCHNGKYIFFYFLEIRSKNFFQNLTPSPLKRLILGMDPKKHCQPMEPTDRKRKMMRWTRMKVKAAHPIVLKSKSP